MKKKKKSKSGRVYGKDTITTTTTNEKWKAKKNVCVCYKCGKDIEYVTRVPYFFGFSCIILLFKNAQYNLWRTSVYGACLYEFYSSSSGKSAL